MLKVCLDISHFRLRDNHYRMEDGLAMGSPVSPPVANLFMAEFEKEALESFEEEKTKKVESICERCNFDYEAIANGGFVGTPKQLTQEH